MLVLAGLVLASAFGAAHAHGTVASYGIGGKNITGYLPYDDPYTQPTPDRAMRKLMGNGPIENVDHPDIQCNSGTAPAKLVDVIAAGETISLQWTNWDASHRGPVMTYLARAPSDITQWDAKDAQWFKIEEAGWSAAKGWAGTQQLYANDHKWPVVIPKDLKPGQYLLRHEILALHVGFQDSGAQFYPNCIQLEVTGSGSALPTDGLVTFPGAYKRTDPGIKYNVYLKDDYSDYVIPGPPVWDGVSNAIGTGASNAAPSPSSAPSPASSAPAAASSAAPTTTPEAAIADPATTTSAQPETQPQPQPTTTPVAEPTVAAPPASGSAPAPAPSVNASACARKYTKCVADGRANCDAKRNACLAGTYAGSCRRSRSLRRRLH